MKRLTYIVIATGLMLSLSGLFSFAATPAQKLQRDTDTLVRIVNDIEVYAALDDSDDYENGAKIITLYPNGLMTECSHSQYYPSVTKTTIWRYILCTDTLWCFPKMVKDDSEPSDLQPHSGKYYLRYLYCNGDKLIYIPFESDVFSPIEDTTVSEPIKAPQTQISDEFADGTFPIFKRMRFHPAASTTGEQVAENDRAERFSAYMRELVDNRLDQLRQYIPEGAYLVMGSKPHDGNQLTDLTIATKTDSQYNTYTYIRLHNQESLFCDSIPLDNPEITRLFSAHAAVEYIDDTDVAFSDYSYYIALYDDNHQLVYEVNRHHNLLDPATNRPDTTHPGSYQNLFILYLAPRMGWQ